MLHISDAGCALVLQADLEYWGVDESSMEACCTLKYYPKIEVCQSERDGEIATKRQEMELAEEEDFGNSDWGRLRSFLWNTMEYPWTSTRPTLCNIDILQDLIKLSHFLRGCSTARTDKPRESRSSVCPEINDEDIS